jgi:hypothetical protein
MCGAIAMRPRAWRPRQGKALGDQSLAHVFSVHGKHRKGAPVFVLAVTHNDDPVPGDLLAQPARSTPAGGSFSGTMGVIADLRRVRPQEADALASQAQRIAVHDPQGTAGHALAGCP